MCKIGVILPCNEKISFLKKFLKARSVENLFVKEYGIEFLCVYDFQNFIPILKKKGVECVVVLSDMVGDVDDLKVLKGDVMYRKMLKEFVRKSIKNTGDDCCVTVVDKNFSEYAVELLEYLCFLCRNVNIVTENKKTALDFAEKVFDKYGALINIYGKGKKVVSHIAVVLEDCGNSYSENCLIISKNYTKNHDRIISDFHIPFLVKPPFGMDDLVFSECIEYGINNS